MESHAGDSLKAVLNSKVEIMEELRRQEASSSSSLRSHHSMLSRLCASIGPVDCVSAQIGDIENQKRRAIIESLRYSDMRLRKDTIPLTYRNTFDWIFSEQYRFRSWLESESGMFWISGKVGSGKSTLMKSISEHALTRNMLAYWAAPHEAHSLDFYFWYTGSELQKSQEGLLRSILHDIFKRYPDLLSKVVPHRWNAPDSFHRAPDTWSRVEMSQALRKIAALDDLGCKICLFLDGLDEFSGDHRALIADLRALCTNKYIKICVSSRPWNVFVSTFSSFDKILHLEDLTADDIYQYASGHLTRTNRRLQPSDVNSLVSEIVLKSQGVFFWVFLVTRSLEEGINEGDSPKILHRRLSEMPSDLEEFFKGLLTRLNKIYKLETSQVLRLAMTLLGPTIIRDSLDNWLDFWLLKELDFSDVDFTIKMNIRFYTLAEITALRQDTRAFINASCRDFLSVSSIGRTVTFLHRTVYDFLSIAEIQDLLNTNVPAIFQDPKFLLHIRLARCKIFLSKTEFGNRQCCYKPLEPPGTRNGDDDEDLVFPGSSALADSFESTVSAFLGVCEDRYSDHYPGCVFAQDWDDIYQFLAANGKFFAILRIAETFDLQHTAVSLIDIARRFPQQSTGGECRDEQGGRTTISGSTKLLSAAEDNLSCEAFVKKLSGAVWGGRQDAVNQLLELNNLGHSSSAELAPFTSEELKLFEPISAEDLEIC